MATYQLSRDSLLRIAVSVTAVFYGDAVYTEKAATDGALKVLIVRNAGGLGTPYFTLQFPGDLLDRYDALAAADRMRFEGRIVAKVRDLYPNYQSAFRSGLLPAHEAYVVEFDDQLLDGI